MGTYKDMAGLLKSMAEAVTGGPAAVDIALRRDFVEVNVAACGAAGTAKNVVLYKAPYDCIVKSGEYIPDAVVTGHADNFAVLDLNKEDGAAGGLESLDSYSTDTDVDGTIAARVGFAWTLTDADTLDAGELLVLEITKPGTGVALPEGIVTIAVERL